ncbi:hypothetical protein H2203_005470 [Taxawa tesnikishii (nom. ined.)]|nr:hypothetical protein H2203_005470 [Dothideales sp. JES 119]
MMRACQEGLFTAFPAGSAQGGANGDLEENAPLLGRRDDDNDDRDGSALKKRLVRAKNTATSLVGSRLAQGVLKCSLAYLLGSLATFVPFISNLIGKQDGKHVVATVTVYFHPARSAGSMHEATALAFFAFIYAAFVSFTSMGVSMFFGQHDLLLLGHAIVLIIFCAGGLGVVAYTKQRLGNPLVNVACSLASLAIITIETKEGSIQAAKFSEAKIVQVLIMIIMGMVATTFVNLVVKPVSARKELSQDLTKTTDYLGDLLVAITRAFLSGVETEMQNSFFKKVARDHQASLASLKKNLSEARWEHYFLGTEAEHQIEAKLVRCLQRLSQNLGGLRSAAATQFDLIKQSPTSVQADGFKSARTVSRRSSFLSSAEMTEDPVSVTESGHLDPIDEGVEDVESNATTTGASTPASNLMRRPTQTPADMFVTFISQLGPPMKSLAYTLKQILDELPFAPGSDKEIAVNSNFHSSLSQAINLFKDARKTALATLYKNKELFRARSIEGVADVEEVAASCGYFSFSLIDFAEDTLVYLDILEELKLESEERPRGRTWYWLKFWKRFRRSTPEEAYDDGALAVQSVEHGTTDIPAPIKRADDFAARAKEQKPWNYRVWQALRLFRQDDIKFATKVGVGAGLFALPSFLQSTRSFYSHWRGEWGLVSYMVVCSMTIGASNTTGLERFLGTGLGAIFAIIAWIIANNNPWILGFLGWLVSLLCFYIILGRGKGPMGRFILLTYNLSALYAYSLSVKDDEDDDDEGGINPEIWEIVLHRFVAVLVGCIWGIVVTRIFWPISARKKLKDGIARLWLRMSLIWKRDPLAMFLMGEPQSAYMDIREEQALQSFLLQLQALRKAAVSEYQLKGPFPDKVVARLLDRTSSMLDAFHAMNTVISQDLKASPGEAEVLRYTRPERYELSARISHLFSVLASSIKLEYPLNDVLPNIEHTRDRLLAKIFEFRRTEKGALATDQDYELLYAYALVTGQLAQDILAVEADIEELFGTLNEEYLELQ